MAESWKIDAKFYGLLHRVYTVGRQIARATGHINFLRMAFGRIAGRFMFRMAPGHSGTFKLNGHDMKLATDNQYPPIDMAVGKYESETVQLMERRVGPGMAMIDIGAHVGFFTLLGAKLVGSTGQIYAFEAEPNNYGVLQANIERNGYQNVIAENQAVSEKCGTTSFFLSGLDNGSHSIYKVRRRMTKGEIEVQTTTIDAFLESKGWPKIDVIKIDVEGAENVVIKGMEKVLASEPSPDLIMEFCPFLLEEAGNPPQLLIHTIKSLGYTVSVIAGDLELTSLEKEEDVSSLISTLLKQQTYVNVFCSKTAWQNSAS